MPLGVEFKRPGQQNSNGKAKRQYKKNSLSNPGGCVERGKHQIGGFGQHKRNDDIGRTYLEHVTTF